jgi:hypothetical protein
VQLWRRDVAIRKAERIAKRLEDCIATVRDDYGQGRKLEEELYAAATMLARSPSSQAR